ncbi:FtsX-like permease family protein [Fulvivirgaceae bacterium BMA10]|uniref:FtsX-like permease family protein n=1 Tax=Splendidivirga corallicola TaxID=3051826 RepID=A0ABT8KR14_9BACT|nr:FtsX-like permease family protein [Fulvivirgaceae bacterium BMA10]
MNLSYFISKRINKTEAKSFASTIHKIAIASIATGLAIMIVSFLILEGFEKTIKEKNFSFAGHLNITKFTQSNSYDEMPISTENDLYQNYQQFDFIEHIQEVSYKFGLVRTDNAVSGIILKGIGKTFDLERFKTNIVEGEFIQFNDSVYSKDIMISKRISNTLGLKVDDEVVMHFIQNPPRRRLLKVSGIYDTGLEEFDDKIILGDIAMIQRLNGWGDEEVGGYELYIKDFDDLEEAERVLDSNVDYDLYVEKVTDRFVQIFDWLTLINRQVLIFLGLILFVACFNMASILLILIMERTQMIGLLKAMGATNNQIRSFFIYNGILIIVKGALIGNAIALIFATIQYYFKIIPLDYENYFMNYVPIEWNWGIIVVLNILTIFIVSVVLLLPSMIISRIRPIKAIRFD